MPTSSERLRARATAYLQSAKIINETAESCDDPLEVEEFYRVGKFLWMEYTRLNSLADEREKKEQGLEHRRPSLIKREGAEN